MSLKICHQCKKPSETFEISGQYRTKKLGFIPYRLCRNCSKKLISINTYSDKSARVAFLEKVKANAKKLLNS